MIFQVGGRGYGGESATEILRALELDTPDYPSHRHIGECEK